MRTTVEVLVPEDRAGHFQEALAEYFASGVFPQGAAGSTGDQWQHVALRLPRRRVAHFYRGFSHWLMASLAEAGQQSLPDLSAAELRQTWEVLSTYEREWLRLLSDDWGRPVGWPEMKHKLALSGPPCPARDLPFLAAQCAHLARALPVRQTGSGDEAVFHLSEEHIKVVLAAGD